MECDECPEHARTGVPDGLHCPGILLDAAGGAAFRADPFAPFRLVPFDEELDSMLMHLIAGDRDIIGHPCKDQLQGAVLFIVRHVVHLPPYSAHGTAGTRRHGSGAPGHLSAGPGSFFPLLSASFSCFAPFLIFLPGRCRDQLTGKSLTLAGFLREALFYGLLAGSAA